MKSTWINDNLCGIVLLLGLFIPHTSTVLMCINPLMCIWMTFLYRHNIRSGSRVVQLVLIASMTISYLFNIINSSIEVKQLLAGINLALLIFCFPFITDHGIKNGYLFLSIGIIILSQLVFVLHISPVIAIIDRLYPVGEEYMAGYDYYLESIDLSNTFGWRSAGLFRNSNQTAKYVTVILGVFLVENKRFTLSSVVFVFVSLLSILLTGSRTGLIICLGLFMLSILQRNKKGILARGFWPIFVLLLILFVLFGSNLSFRNLQVTEGLDNSVNVKANVLQDYLEQDLSVFQFLFGNADSSRYVASSGSMLNKFDAEYGYLIYKFGFIGFSLFLLFWIDLFKTTPKRQRFLFTLLLWGITSSILMAYRSAFIFMFIMSLYARENKKLELL